MDTNSGYSQQNVEGTEMIMYNKKLCIPKVLCRHMINWYHHFLCHPGGDRLAKTLNQVCEWKGMTNQCKDFCKKCKVCQKYKSRSRKYGRLPPKKVNPITPWQTVHVNLVGPYKASVTHNELGGGG